MPLLCEQDVFDIAGIDVAFDEVGVVHDFLVQRDCGLDAFNLELAKRPLHAGDRA